MTQSSDFPAWIALFLGLYSLAAAIGELRMPGTWQKMLKELAGSPALLITISFFETGLGAVIYLASPWDPTDLLASAMNLLGGLMVIEGILLAAFGNRFIGFWAILLAPLMRLWLLLAAVIGVVLIVAAIPRF